MKLSDQVELIQEREDFVTFVHALLKRLKESSQTWENRDLESYLEAMAAWVEDMDGYFQNIGQAVPKNPSWKLLAQILIAASIYE